MSAAASSPHVMPTYGRLPVAFARGEGCRVFDTDGKSYLDMLGGIAVNTLGHSHPKMVSALQEQVGKLIHTSNYYHIPLQEELASKLVQLSGLKNVFFCSTGLEANEAALKIARKFGRDKGIENPQVVVYEGAFHGRSMATLSATANPKVHAGFEPLVPGFVRLPINQIEALHEACNAQPNIVAVFLEAIQGEGGIHTFTDDYLREVRALCDERDLLLMIDEVQCGIGRTGKWFAHQWAGIKPDVMPLAKGLGSGVPVGAVVAGERAAGVLQAGNHGSTFGGNPLAMRAGVETLRIMEEEGLIENAAKQGAYLQQQLQAQLGGLSGVQEVRGKGLMVGVELEQPCGDLMQQCLDAGLLISITAANVIRLVPPLVVTQVEVDEALDILVPIVERFLASQPKNA